MVPSGTFQAWQHRFLQIASVTWGYGGGAGDRGVRGTSCCPAVVVVPRDQRRNWVVIFVVCSRM